MKRLIQGAALALVLGAAFLVGYGTLAKAWPGVGDRDEYRGFFSNVYDDQGYHVILNGFPGWVNNAATYTAFIKNQLYNGTARDRVGAAFIIQIQRGNNGNNVGFSRNNPPTPAEVADWEARVFFSESQGWITWFGNFTYTGNSYYQGVNGGGPEPNDDAFYWENGTRQSVIFRNGAGQAVGAIKRDCANPLTFGFMPGLPPALSYSMSGRTTVSSPTVKPGQSVTFNHYVRNDGPGSTGSTPIWWIAQSMPSQAGVGGPASSGTYAAGQEKNVFNHTANVPINAVVGSQICERVGWDPVTPTVRDGRGPTVCSTVIPDFNLTPTVSVDRSNGAEGDQVTFTYQVSSSGVTATTTIACTPVGNNRAPGYSPLPQQDVARASDGGYTPPATNCPRTFPANAPPTTVATETITLGSLTAGSRVCRSLTVNPKNEVGGPRTSAETCVLIAKTPYSWFMGNDIWAGGGFAAVNPLCNTSAKITTVGRTLTSGLKAGSVVEYQAFALNQITSFGSASRVLNQYGAVGDPSRSLTFANSEPTVSRLGYYGAPSRCINDYVANYTSATALAPGTYNVGGRGSGTWRITGAITLNGTMPASGKQVYYATGDVTISGNLNYPASYADAAAIPSLLIITTGNIRIAPGVQQVDGMLVARGNGTTSGVVYTCWPKNEPISVSHACNTNQLTINGSVAAARLDLARAFGGTGNNDPARQAAAEQFRFSPELYLSNVLSTSSSTTIETTNVLDLPPRF